MNNAGASGRQVEHNMVDYLRYGISGRSFGSCCWRPPSYYVVQCDNVDNRNRRLRHPVRCILGVSKEPDPRNLRDAESDSAFTRCEKIFNVPGLRIPAITIYCPKIPAARTSTQRGHSVLLALPSTPFAPRHITLYLSAIFQDL